MSSNAKSADLRSIVLSRFWFKAFGTSAFTFVFFVAYLFLLQHPQSAVSTVPATWLDDAIGFQPAALPVYLSLWVYVSLPPLIMRTRSEIVDYGVRIGTLCATGLAVFYFWPNAVPPAHIDWAQYPGMAFLKKIDAAGNACPSLHVATAVFSSLWLFWRLRHLGLGWMLQLLNIAWCVGIAYSTLATKQHVTLDVFAGTALALGLAQLTGIRDHACGRSQWLRLRAAPA